jgi:hypothetical protein
MIEFSLPPDFDFGQQFDRVTLTRAMALNPDQSVLSMHTHGSTLLTRMQGIGLAAYDQRISLLVDRLGLRVQGHCTCPVGLNCPHVAAALMAFEAREIRRKKNPELAPAVRALGGSPPPPPAPVRQAERPVENLGTLKLVPVLRLTTAVDVASEALLHHRYGSNASRNTTLRQASAQFILRYVPENGAPLEYHYPAGAAEQTLAERADLAHPGQTSAVRFQRQGKEEASALLVLFNELGFRPWSLAAGLAHNRLTKVGARAAHTAPHALEGQPLVLVPQLRDQWPTLLAKQLPELQERGWAIELADDFRTSSKA